MKKIEREIHRIMNEARNKIVEMLYSKLDATKPICDECGGSGEVKSNTLDCDVQICRKCKGKGKINKSIKGETNE
jgi:DnaJ-class molecular chaperone